MARTRPRLATSALLVGTFLAALDTFIVSTAMPTVVSQLGGLRLYGWVFSIYLLASTSTVPLYGGLADALGRKPLYLVATGFFLAGSALCGTAPSMGWLIAFRALQGVGAGGLIPITITLFGDLYAAEQRAVVQGLFSTVWGVSSVLGPLLGGFFVTYISWRWAFWVNLPIGLAAAAILWFTLHERAVTGRRQIDLLGALLLTGALALPLLGLESGAGHRALLLAGTGALCAVLLVPVERRAARPVLPLRLFSHRAILVSCLAGFALGTQLTATIAFIPLFVQGVLQRAPTAAGLALVPLSLIWTVGTFATGAACRRLGYRPVVLVAGALSLVGPAVLLLFVDDSSPRLLYVATGIIGAAMGLSITPMTLAVQDAVSWEQRGAATALVTFTRTVGGMIAVTLLGAAVTSRFSASMAHHGLGELAPGELLEPARWAALAPGLRAQASAAMGDALRVVFRTMTAAGVAALLLAALFPRLQLERDAADD